MFRIAPEGLSIWIRPAPWSEIPAEARSIIGHEDMAAILSGILHRSVVVNRETVTLDKGDELYVVQYRGPRLKPGVDKLPKGAVLELLHVEVRADG